MKSKITYIIISAVVIVFQTQGQDLKNYLRLSLGADHIARQDLIFSAFILNDF